MDKCVLFIKKYWGFSIMIMGAILFIGIFVIVHTPQNICHWALYLVSSATYLAGIIRHEGFEEDPQQN